MSALKTAALIAASALIAVLAIRADPQNNPKDEKAVLQVAGEAREASRTHDLIKIQQMLTEDFLAIDPSGRLRNKAEFIDMMRNMSPELVVANAELQVSVQEVRVRQYGNAAVLTELRTVKSVPEPSQARYAQVWVKEQGSWRLCNLQVTRIAIETTAEGRNSQKK